MGLLVASFVHLTLPIAAVQDDLHTLIEDLGVEQIERREQASGTGMSRRSRRT